MKFFLCITLLLPAFSQTTPSAGASAAQNQFRAAPKPQPAAQIIKPKDYHDQTGYLHPFLRMGRYFLEDQKVIWTSPFHATKSDGEDWLIFGGATGALIGTDKYVSKNAPNPGWLKTLGTDVSYLGDPYTLLPIAAGLYFGGTKFHDDHFRETGLLSFESLADVTVIELVLKSVFDRERPTEGHGNGEFEASTSPRWNSSFPSGHAIETFALASVIAHEYPHTLWAKILAYSYAGGVVGARLAANRHFPGDVLAGSAIGWFVGDHVYHTRHNPELDKNPNISERILDHVHFGGPAPDVPLPGFMQ